MPDFTSIRSILDVDEKTVDSQVHSGDECKEGNDATGPVEDSNSGAKTDTTEGDTPIKNDLRFAKYFTMLKMVNYQYSFVVRRFSHIRAFR